MLTALADRIAIRPKGTLLAVLAFVVIAGVFGGPVAGLLRDSGGFTAEDAGSAVAIERIEAATGRQAAPGIVVLVKTPQGADAPAARARVATLERELSAQSGIASVASPASTRDERFVASDGRSTYLAATLDADAEEGDVSTAVLERYEDAADVEVGGSVIADEQIGGAVGADLGRAEGLAFPILLILSLLFFRGGRAALIPLVVAVATVTGTFLALRGVNSVYGLSVFALNLVIGLGIGLAIGALALTPFGAPGSGPAWTSLPLLGACLLVGVFSNAIGYGIDQHVLRRISVRRFSVLLALLPVTAVAFGWILLDQAPSAVELCGIALVLGGVAIQERDEILAPMPEPS